MLPACQCGRVRSMADVPNSTTPQRDTSLTPYRRYCNQRLQRPSPPSKQCHLPDAPPRRKPSTTCAGHLPASGISKQTTVQPTPAIQRPQTREKRPLPIVLACGTFAYPSLCSEISAVQGRGTSHTHATLPRSGTIVHFLFGRRRHGSNWSPGLPVQGAIRTDNRLYDGTLYFYCATLLQVSNYVMPYISSLEMDVGL